MHQSQLERLDLPLAVLAPFTSLRADQHPVAVYLARLSPGSRRAMRQALEVVAALLSSGKSDTDGLPWPSLRYQHTQAVRAHLAEKYAPVTANNALSVLRGVLGECLRLGYMSAEDHARATDLPNVKGQSAPRGRALKTGDRGPLRRVRRHYSAGST